MTDPLRILSASSFPRGGQPLPSFSKDLILRQDPLQYACRLIARNELHIWFEPDWGLARQLARRFPSCLVYSIPHESNTPSLHRIPGWRRHRHTGARV